MIPNVIHFIWIGSPLPDWAAANIEAFRILNSSYEIKLWTEPTELLPEYAVGYERATHLEQQSDLLRYSILQREGGWYFDVDCVPYRSLTALDAQYQIGERLFIYRYKPGSRKHINNAMLASVPGCLTWDVVRGRIVDVIEAGQAERNCYGPPLFRRCIEDMPDGFCIGDPPDFGEPHESHVSPPAEWPDGRTPFVYHVGREI